MWDAGVWHLMSSYNQYSNQISVREILWIAICFLHNCLLFVFVVKCVIVAMVIPIVEVACAGNLRLSDVVVFNQLNQVKCPNISEI